jgi:hypothetical protein
MLTGARSVLFDPGFPAGISIPFIRYGVAPQAGQADRLSEYFRLIALDTATAHRFSVSDKTRFAVG